MRPGRQRPPGHAVALDGIFGPQTDAAVKAFQTSKGLTANGTVDPTTWKALIVQVKKGASGDAVRGVQEEFQFRNESGDPTKGVQIDGAFGPQTDAAVRGFQHACRSTFPRSRWTASSAQSPGRRWSAACCRASGASRQLPTSLGSRAAPGQNVVGATQKTGWNHYPPVAFTISLGLCGGGLQWEKGIPLFGGCGLLLRSSRLCRQPS
jgi:peptidoglycan hydrolase-like protein with peptidoglycan-binding domain